MFLFQCSPERAHSIAVAGTLPRVVYDRWKVLKVPAVCWGGPGLRHGAKWACLGWWLGSWVLSRSENRLLVTLLTGFAGLRRGGAKKGPGNGPLLAGRGGRGFVTEGRTKPLSVVSGQ
jgi:hypothetical protein